MLLISLLLFASSPQIRERRSEPRYAEAAAADLAFDPFLQLDVERVTSLVGGRPTAVDAEIFVACDVRMDGSVEACVPLREDPKNSGYAQAAATLAGGARLTPAAAAEFRSSSLKVLFRAEFTKRPRTTVALEKGSDQCVGAEGSAAIVRTLGSRSIDLVPNVAIEKGLAGRVTVSCAIDDSGRPAACRLVDQQPAGLDLRQAAKRFEQLIGRTPLPLQVATCLRTKALPLVFNFRWRIAPFS